MRLTNAVISCRNPRTSSLMLVNLLRHFEIMKGKEEEHDAVGERRHEPEKAGHAH